MGVGLLPGTRWPCGRAGGRAGVVTAFLRLGVSTRDPWTARHARPGSEDRAGGIFFRPRDALRDAREPKPVSEVTRPNGRLALRDRPRKGSIVTRAPLHADGSRPQGPARIRPAPVRPYFERAWRARKRQDPIRHDMRAPSGKAAVGRWRNGNGSWRVDRSTDRHCAAHATERETGMRRPLQSIRSSNCDGFRSRTLVVDKMRWRTPRYHYSHRPRVLLGRCLHVCLGRCMFATRLRHVTPCPTFRRRKH